jgi:pantoate--beta-alanine ligase
MSVAVVTTVADTRRAVAVARGQSKRIGLVPTMGALHAGHVSLIRTARTGADFVVVSIFVNPAQFGPKEDLSRYPRPIAQDIAVCEAEHVDLICHPEVAEVYPPGFQTHIEVTELQKGLCGASRPGHFRGVATVVLKLFNIVQPDIAYFGQKDAQQARIIEQMVRDLNVPVTIQVCPIVREADGLALSSRNEYLDPVQRRHATVLHRSLGEVRERVQAGERDAGRLLELLHERIAATPGAVLDYAVIVDAGTLQPVDRVDGPALAALAVFFGTTRLIDNMLLRGE